MCTMTTPSDLDAPRPSQAPTKLQIGAKLKMVRKAHRLSMRDLAARVGCSESLISKIENDRLTPSLPTLHRLAAELGTTIGRLFADSNPTSDLVTRNGHRATLNLDAIGRIAGTGIRLEAVAVNGDLLYSSIHVIDAGGSSGGFIEHIGEELGYVLEGQVEITVDGKPHMLFQGDSIFFPSNLPHGYRNPGDQVAKILWINTPPTF